MIGTAGIVLQASPDNGRTWLAAEQLGTATTYKMRIPVNGVLTDTGVQWTIGPSTTNAAYVALAVELRADALAHLANATAHDGAGRAALNATRGRKFFRARDFFTRDEKLKSHAFVLRVCGARVIYMHVTRARL